MVWFGKARQGKTRFCLAGGVWRGVVWRGKAQCGEVRCGRRGEARSGGAWLGKVRPGLAGMVIVKLSVRSDFIC